MALHTVPGLVRWFDMNIFTPVKAEIEADFANKSAKAAVGAGPGAARNLKRARISR